MKLLEDRRILITRARHQAESLAIALEKEGAEVLAIPAIEIVPPDSYASLDDALNRISKYQWLILTSVNGVSVLVQRLRHLAISPDALRDVKIAAIGPATARALTAQGFTVGIVPPEYVAESLVEALICQVAGSNVLLVRAKVARDVIPDELGRAGAVVDVAEAYQTIVPATSCTTLQQALAAQNGSPDAVTFTSSSTVTNFYQLMHQAGILTWPQGIAVASIGPITSRTLREHGVEPTMEAKEFTISGLVTSLCQGLGRKI